MVVQRTDIDLDSSEGRALAISDNRVGEVSLDWDSDVLVKISKEVDLRDFWFDDELDMLGIQSEKSGSEEDSLSQFSSNRNPCSEDRPFFGETWNIGAHRVICGDAERAGEIVSAIKGWESHTGMTAMHESGKTFAEICKERGYE